LAAYDPTGIYGSNCWKDLGTATTTASTTTTTEPV